MLQYEGEFSELLQTFHSDSWDILRAQQVSLPRLRDLQTFCQPIKGQPIYGSGALRVGERARLLSLLPISAPNLSSLVAVTLHVARCFNLANITDLGVLWPGMGLHQLEAFLSLVPKLRSLKLDYERPYAWPRLESQLPFLEYEHVVPLLARYNPDLEFLQLGKTDRLGLAPSAPTASHSLTGSRNFSSLTKLRELRPRFSSGQLVRLALDPAVSRDADIITLPRSIRRLVLVPLTDESVFSREAVIAALARVAVRYGIRDMTVWEGRGLEWKIGLTGPLNEDWVLTRLN
jgi:hypothetical protein